MQDQSQKPTTSATPELHTLDMRGHLCPQPLIKTRRLWKTLAAGEQFQVLVDNDIAHLNLVSFLNDQGAGPSVQKEGDDCWVIVASRAADSAISNAAARAKSAANTAPEVSLAVGQQPANQPANYIVVLKSDCMGHGDDDLGRLLVKGYLNTLRELENKPTAIILYNGGALIANQGSGSEAALRTLEEDGVDVIVCGACVDFFAIKETLVAGRISNMYEIADKIAKTGHVVYP
ncbi:sulfurtransferase-like selenium metabolism protein YedF [Endozoicomonas sp. SESOKO1]|uniref:sulfurtransferase-like selenium metabolism protein YedF n=1 Tax=Endozoicomonas sp. SESOKO1 TaxID=2828742 RepID=UPI0021477FF0